MRKIYMLSSLIFTMVLLLQSCDNNLPYRDETLNLPSTTYNYQLDNLPDHYQNTVSPTEAATISNEGATLGRVLFYDRKLSINNSTACGSCHLQSKAFSDGLQLSEGFNHQKTDRNSPSIVNAITASAFFWDAREDDLETMVLKPVRNHVEMGLEKLEDMEVKLSATSYYPELFEAAFGTPEITKERIADAMTQFLKSMVTVQSKYDAGRNSNFDNFSEAELNGFSLFNGKALCATCHSGEDFRGWQGQTNWANIGLEMEYTDPGVGEFVENMEGAFKVPSLRNVALTAPYMHDGRFATLEEVVDHYNSGMQEHDNLDWRLRDPWTGEPWRLGLTTAEKSDLIAFIKTLTDQNLIIEERFSNPFGE